LRISSVWPLRIDQYRCYHAVGRTRRQRTAISLVPCASISTGATVL
jgi:hypothetical protein